MNEEVWKDVEDYEGYYTVSNLGNVYSIKTRRVLKYSLNTQGYPTISLSKEGVKKSFTIHNIVANTFLLKEVNSLQVNHKDENKLNNEVTNLEFITPKENANYGSRNLRVIQNRTGKYKPKKVLKLDLNMQALQNFESIADAARELGVKNSAIRRVCEGERNKVHNFIYKYI